MSLAELNSVGLNLQEEIKAIRNFFTRSSPTVNSPITKCDLCLLPFNCESSFISDNTFAVIRHSFLIKLNHASYSPYLFPECANSFVQLCGLFHELRRLRSEFNVCRRELGRRIISSSLGTPGEYWEQEISKTESTYPFCVEIKYDGINLSHEELDRTEDMESTSHAFIMKGEEGERATKAYADDVSHKQDSPAQTTDVLPQLERDTDLTEMDLEDVYYIDDDDDNDVKYDPDESYYFSDDKDLAENNDINIIESNSTDLINHCKEKLPISSVVSSMANTVRNEQVQLKLNLITYWNTIKDQQNISKSNKKNFKCKLCPVTFTASTSLSRHTLQQHDTQETKCPTCTEVLCGQKASKCTLNILQVRIGSCS